MFKKWKEEWLKKNEYKLKGEYEAKLASLEKDYKEVLDLSNKVYSDSKKKYQELTFQQAELDELSTRLGERKLALAHENEELKQQLKIAEAKSAPSSVWESAFTCGFSKAWEMMKLQQEGFEKVKKIVEDKAINDTLRRLNGNNKKAY